MYIKCQRVFLFLRDPFGEGRAMSVFPFSRSVFVVVVGGFLCF